MAMADRTGTSSTTGHTVAGVFNDQSDAQRALNELKSAGFSPDPCRPEPERSGRGGRVSTHAKR
jgi:hypothetical protein